MTQEEKFTLLTTVLMAVQEDPSFAKDIMDRVSFALQQRVNKAEELAHQKDLALITAIALMNMKNNGDKLTDSIRKKFENDIIVHGILCSSDYENVQKRMEVLCEAEKKFIQNACNKIVS